MEKQIDGTRVGRSSNHPRKCFYCDQSGHIKRSCPKKKQDDLDKLKCFKCGVAGHLQRNCPQTLHVVSEKTFSQDADKKNGSALSDDVSLLSLEHTHTSNIQQGASREGTEIQHNIVGNPCVSSLSYATASSTVKGGQLPTYIDTHCHLEYVFSRYHHQGSFGDFTQSHTYPDNFEGCISTFCDPAAFSSFGIWQDLLKEPNVWGTFGIHPHNSKYYYSNGPELEDKLLKCIEHPKCVAYGEIGLDYAKHSPSDQQTQREILVRQLEVALPFSKPLIFHCRDAEEELLHIVSKYVPRDWKIHLHCYTGSGPLAVRFLENFPNLYLGVCGNVTYHNSRNSRHIASNLPLERLVIETDAPYNTPSNMTSPCRFSHPAQAFYVAEEIAFLRSMDISEVLTVIRRNTQSLYGM